MNQVDVHILKSEIRTRELSLSGMEAGRDVHISTVACSNLVVSFPLGRRERSTRICSNWGNDFSS